MSEVYLPKDLKEKLLQSFASVCGVFALHLILEDKSEDEKTETKNAIIRTVEEQWKKAFQEDMANYSNALKQVENAHILESPEDLQIEYNKIIKDARKSMRLALFGEENEK